MDIEIYTPFKKLTFTEKDALVSFLHKHLGEYGDKPEDIGKAIDFAMKERSSHGGFIVIGKEDGKIIGAVVMNKTGMEGYIPENILVYIAVHEEARGKGVGKKLMKAATERAEGAVALHVEPENPAVHLYKKMGFTNKYLEMRLAAGAKVASGKKEADSSAQ